jgi:transposase
VIDVSSIDSICPDELKAHLAQVASERDHFRKLYLEMLERCRRLEQGLNAQRREKFPAQDGQLCLAMLAMMKGLTEAATPAPEAATETQEAGARQRKKPTGRKPIPEHLPRVVVELIPPEVQQKGLEAFDRLDGDVCETIEHRRQSMVVVRIVRPKFIPKGRNLKLSVEVLQAAPADLPIERGLAGPGLLAETIVRRWQDHLPLHRLEGIFGRDGIELARSTICGWHAMLSALVAPLIRAMWKEALTAAYLCIDATGVLVQAPERCKNGHFWVVVAPDLHVLFRYSSKHDGDAVDRMLAEYKGYLVADAHVVYDHLYRTGRVIESGCWAHCRRYFFKALGSDPDRARHALGLIQELFMIERLLAGASPKDRLKARTSLSLKVIEKFFAWCDEHAVSVIDETPICAAIRYARNQRLALQRFLEDDRLPIHNNISELQLRRQAVGRKNWLFLGSEEAGDVNATFVSLLASCQLHGLEPLAYLRDLFCLIPTWPAHRVLELAPAHWKKTLENEETQRRLAGNVFRRASLGELIEHRPVN